MSSAPVIYIAGALGESGNRRLQTWAYAGTLVPLGLAIAELPWCFDARTDDFGSEVTTALVPGFSLAALGAETAERVRWAAASSLASNSSRLRS